MQATKSTQAEVEKVSSPKRTPKRHSAAKYFSVWRQTCIHHNHCQKANRNRAAIKGPRLHGHTVKSGLSKQRQFIQRVPVKTRILSLLWQGHLNFMLSPQYSSLAVQSYTACCLKTNFCCSKTASLHTRLLREGLKTAPKQDPNLRPCGCPICCDISCCAGQAL